MLDSSRPSDPLTRDEATLELAGRWRATAAVLEELDADDRAARALRQCAESLEEVVGAHALEWFTHGQVRVRTGRSDSYLYRLYRRLQPDGLARKADGGGWEVQREAATRIPIRRGHTQVENSDDVAELAAHYLARGRRAQ